MDNLNITPISLAMSFSLVLIAMAIVYKEKLDLNKDILIAVTRMIVQLTVVGYILDFIFGLDSPVGMAVIISVMVFNGAYNASKYKGKINHGFVISLIGIGVSLAIVLVVLVVTRSIEFIPSQIIPITGMIVGNGMQLAGLAFRNLNTMFEDRHQQLLERISLGADPRETSNNIIKESIKTSLQPTIDRIKTLGVVSLPGMMSGMIMAGVEPMKAILYQIVVFFFMISTGAITGIIIMYLSYPGFFDEKGRIL